MNNGLPPLPDNYANGEHATNRVAWVGLPALPPDYRWIVYAQDPAIVNKEKEPRTPIAWVTSGVDDAGLCVEMWLNYKTEKVSCTVVEACHILATRCWLGEF